MRSQWAGIKSSFTPWSCWYHHNSGVWHKTWEPLSKSYFPSLLSNITGGSRAQRPLKWAKQSISGSVSDGLVRIRHESVLTSEMMVELLLRAVSSTKIGHPRRRRGVAKIVDQGMALLPDFSRYLRQALGTLPIEAPRDITARTPFLIVLLSGQWVATLDYWPGHLEPSLPWPASKASISKRL